MLQDIGLFAGAPPELLQRLESRVLWPEFEPGELIMDFDDESNEVFIVTKGAVRILMRTSLGHELILGDFQDEAMIGEMAAIDGSRRGANVTALVRTRACRIPAAVFLEIVLNAPEVSLRVMRMLSTRLRLANAKFLENCVLSVRLRLLSELLRLARPSRQGKGLVVSPPPVQSDLAARIGARREAVSRDLNTLEHEGLVRRERGGIFIPDAALLRREIEQLGISVS